MDIASRTEQPGPDFFRPSTPTLALSSVSSTTDHVDNPSPHFSTPLLTPSDSSLPTDTHNLSNVEENILNAEISDITLRLATNTTPTPSPWTELIPIREFKDSNNQPISLKLDEDIYSGNIEGKQVDWDPNAIDLLLGRDQAKWLVFMKPERRKALTEQACVQLMTEYGLSRAVIIAGPHGTTKRHDRHVQDLHHITVSCEISEQENGVWHIYVEPVGVKDFDVIGWSCVAESELKEEYSWGRYTSLDGVGVNHPTAS